MRLVKDSQDLRWSQLASVLRGGGPFAKPKKSATITANKCGINSVDLQLYPSRHIDAKSRQSSEKIPKKRFSSSERPPAEGRFPKLDISTATRVPAQ